MPEPDREPSSSLGALELIGYEHAATLPEATTVEKLVLKSGELFASTNRVGDIHPAGARDQGFFYRDTRFLSHLKLTVAGGPPVILSAQVSPDFVTQVDMTVTSASFGGVFGGEPINFLHLRRNQLIDGCLVDRFVLTNFLTQPVDYWIALEFACDFADVFEVRGARRERRGTYLAPLVEGPLVVWEYRGLDKRRYRTELHFSDHPAALDARSARFEMHLEPNASAALELLVNPAIEDVRDSRPLRSSFAERLARTHDRDAQFVSRCVEVESDDPVFDAAVRQALSDLNTLTLPDGRRRIIAAGVPWYAVPFGRDSLITSYQALPFAPELARDSLAFLAAYQGTKDDPDTEEQPGRIPHELRYGEMAAAGEIPHKPYYGTVDATPLFLVVLHEYLQWTGDRETVLALLPAAEAALAWIEGAGDADGDGFVEYQRRGRRGLVNQGWKDSSDGVCRPDGSPLEGSVALVEVQGYVLDAFRRMALLYRQLGIRGKASRLMERAQVLAQRIDEAFWDAAGGAYGIALDGEKRLAPTVTSNAGHLLWSQAIPKPRARAVADTLLGPASFSGWGIRTLAEGQRAYNPLSYHNGTIWPHDNSLVAMGFANYGLPHAVERVFEALYAASAFFPQRRLPELFCGLARREGEFPVHYPVACSPQAWASAAILLLLRASLGLFADAPHQRLTIKNPHLPPWVDELSVNRLRVGATSLDLRFHRSGEGCFASLPSVEGAPLRVRVDLQKHG